MFLLIINFIKNYILKTIIFEHKWLMICGLLYISSRILILILFNQSNLDVTNPLISYLNSFHRTGAMLYSISILNLLRLSFNLISSDLRSYFAVIMFLLLSLPYIINYSKKIHSLDNLERLLLPPLIFVIFFLLIIAFGRVVIEVILEFGILFFAIQRTLRLIYHSWKVNKKFLSIL